MLTRLILFVQLLKFRLALGVGMRVAEGEEVRTVPLLRKAVSKRKAELTIHHL